MLWCGKQYAYYRGVKVLRSGYILLAQKLQEAADLMNSDVAARLSDQIQDMHRGTGHYANYLDHSGDSESGDVVYSVDGNVVSAPYEMSSDGDGAAKCFVHADKATNVVPRTIYEPEADQDELDEYAKMTEAALYTRGPMPLLERKIPKSERDNASAGSFAGKGKSFPILKPEDVAAAAHALGRAGSGNYSTDVIKKNIIRIAKEKGWTSQLPHAWQDDASSKESRRVREAKKPMKDCPDCEGTGEDGDDDCDTCDGTGKVPMFAKSKESAAARGGMRLVESADTLETIRLVEAKADYEIKLIAPGKGSSAFYPAEVLKRDGPQVFRAGTHVYLNHATRAEEAERPEGDVKNLAGVLTTDAIYHESHAKGPGLYGRMKVFADHAQIVEEKAPHVGMSIRASGVAESGKSREGLPVLAKLTAAESVDVVTKAGAGGMILTESARTRAQESSMDAEEKLLLQRLVEKDIRREAITEGARVLEDVNLPESAKVYIIETVVDRGVPKEAGALDIKKFTDAVNAEARRFGGAIGAGPRVTGMGAPAPVELTESQRKAIAEQEQAEVEQYKESAAGLLRTDDAKVLERFLKGRAA